MPRLSLKRVASALAFALAGVATASAFPGGGMGGGGFGGGGVGGGFAGGGVHAGGIGAITGPFSSVGLYIPSTAMTTQQFRDLNVIGRVGVKPGSEPLHSTMIRLTLDGHEIPMQLDTEMHSAELEFNPNDSYARDLYRSMLTRRVEVVGRQPLRDQIAEAAEQSKPLQIEGYVFDATSPYLVVKSVKGD